MRLLKLLWDTFKFDGSSGLFGQMPVKPKPPALIKQLRIIRVEFTYETGRVPKCIGMPMKMWFQLIDELDAEHLLSMTRKEEEWPSRKIGEILGMSVYLTE